MFLQFKTCRRKGILSTLPLFFLTLLVDRAEAEPLDGAAKNTTLQDLSHLYLVPEASCVGYEGQWNCLSDKFQHCAGGQWSAVLSCSNGGSGYVDEAESLCSPLGRTDLVEFEGECNAAWGWGGGGGGGGWSGGGGTSCSGNRCFYGAGERLGVERWVYASVVGAVLVGFW
ncbi:hypothetical protein CT0861_06990 [Colletotrichum tofieldiae]|uniref:Uncharacterized protein n=1 Tax=Colletotrichum tofieldiae TaxID=708197 RepID=A0A166WEX9_9PEZI|nr:hypothetical protein CT0861_06990 [Colletotrichum tofieldiae]